MVRGSLFQFTFESTLESFMCDSGDSEGARLKYGLRHKYRNYFLDKVNVAAHALCDAQTSQPSVLSHENMMRSDQLNHVFI